MIGCIHSKCRISNSVVSNSLLFTHYKSLYPAVGDTCTQMTGLTSDKTCWYDIASTRQRLFNFDRVSLRVYDDIMTPASLITSNSLVHLNRHCKVSHAVQGAPIIKYLFLMVLALSHVDDCCIYCLLVA